MIRVTTEIIVNQPPQEVFDFISNFENNPQWQSGMVTARFTSGGPLGLGSTYDQTAKFLGREIKSTFEVVAFEPGRLVKASTTSGSFPITFTRTVEPEGAGTRVKAIIEGEASGFFKLAESLMAGRVKRSIEEDYKNLKRILESPD